MHLKEIEWYIPEKVPKLVVQEKYSEFQLFLPGQWRWLLWSCSLIIFFFNSICAVFSSLSVLMFLRSQTRFLPQLLLMPHSDWNISVPCLVWKPAITIETHAYRMLRKKTTDLTSNRTVIAKRKAIFSRLRHCHTKWFVYHSDILNWWKQLVLVCTKNKWFCFLFRVIY